MIIKNFNRRQFTWEFTNLKKIYIITRSKIGNFNFMIWVFTKNTSIGQVWNISCISISTSQTRTKSFITRKAWSIFHMMDIWFCHHGKGTKVQSRNWIKKNRERRSKAFAQNLRSTMHLNYWINSKVTYIDIHGIRNICSK